MRAAVLGFAVASIATLACSTKNNASKPDTTAPATAMMPPSADPAAVRQAIDSANARFSAAFVKADTATMAAAYADDAIMMGANEKAVRGRAAIAKSMGGMFSSMKVPSFALKTDDVIVSGDYAIETGNYDMQMQPKTGKAMHDVGKYIVVWKHQPDGSWKIIRDIYNSDMPMPGAK